MGHLTRAVALARSALGLMNIEDSSVLGRESVREICLLTNSPYAELCSVSNELGRRANVLTLHSSLTRDELAAQALEAIESIRFDVLVVDTFPRGLAGELVDVLRDSRCRKVLVHRDINPRYVERFKLRAIANQYDVLLLPGEGGVFEDMPHAVRTAPWMIRDSHELQSAASARERLGVKDSGTPVLAVVACGRTEEVEEYRTLAHDLADSFDGRVAVRLVTMEETAGEPITGVKTSDVVPICVWPFLEFMLGVDVIVGAGGYNTVHETRATGTPLIALSRPRMYDRQERRLRPWERATSLADVCQRARGVLRCISSTESRLNVTPRYSNGVHRAIEIIGPISSR